MFDIELPDPAALATLDVPALIDAITASSKLESAVQARRLLAIGEFWDRRKREAGAGKSVTELYATDAWDRAVAEVGAAMGITKWRAEGLIGTAEALHDRLPAVASVFADGDIDPWIVSIIVLRTELIKDPELMAKVDRILAKRSRRWAKLSRNKIGENIDHIIERFDPAGVRAPRNYEENRYVEVAPTRSGMGGISASVHAADAEAFDQQLDNLASTVCPNDPRTKMQLRADAIRALSARKDRMECRCDSPDCTAGQAEPAGDVVIHVLAESSTLEGESDVPGHVPGMGPIPATEVRELAKSARLKPLIVPKPGVGESGYRPSAALAQFIRFRDLTCRFPGCDCPAERADIDHTIAYPLGPTHPSNLKLLCRKHHLIKTFFSGPGGWNDRQLPDGTIIWKSPTGHTHITKPGGSLFFPALAAPTGEVPAPRFTGHPEPARLLRMPLRRRTRAQDRAARRNAERAENSERLQRLRRAQEARARADPPPF